jgi:hypothetical protein
MSGVLHKIGISEITHLLIQEKKLKLSFSMQNVCIGNK